MSKNITEIPFFAILFDCFPHLEQQIQTMDQSEITDEQWWVIARWWRNVLLTESDWSQVGDNSLSEEQRELWRSYRQELRDISNNYTNPREIRFPDLP
jgi:hypothetical protein